MGGNTCQENTIIYPDKIETIDQFKEQVEIFNTLLLPALSGMIPLRTSIAEVGCSYGFLSEVLPDRSYIGYESDPIKVMMAKSFSSGSQYVNAYIPRYSLSILYDVVIVMEPWRVCEPYAQLDALLNLSNAWHAKRYIFNYHLPVPNPYGLTKLFNVVNEYNYSLFGNNFILSEVTLEA